MSNLKSDLKVVLVQANQIWEDKSANLSHYDELLASVNSADVILLPEMFHTGFSMNSAKLAEDIEHSEGIAWLRARAKAKKAAFFTSLIIKDHNKYFNRGVFVEPSGELFIYDKQKTFGLAGEDKFYSAGNKNTIVDYLGWKIQLQICYDLRFPELSRNRLTGHETAYDLLLYVANWPEKRRAHWQTLLKARAIENQSYVAAVNRVGLDGAGLTYTGDSVVINPLGEESICEAGVEEIKEIVLSKGELGAIRKALPFLKDI